MKVPQLSVIVPVYNAEKTLRQCVDSILSQAYEDFELLLIDDGSKDSSPIICNEFEKKDARVRVFHKPNGGVSSARNVGLDYAQGEWITFIDSDDYITEQYLENVDGSGDKIFIKGYKSFTGNGIVCSRTANEIVQDLGYKDFLNHYLEDTMFRGPVFKFYKRSVIGNLRFLPEMKIGEDAYFVFKYLAKCKSYAVLHSGEYMVRVADKPDEIRYAVTVDYAIESLNHLKKAFEGLVQAHDIDKSHFLSFISYFKRISQSDWQYNKAKWYGNKNVKAFYDYVWPALSAKQKYRILVARILKK